MGVVAPAEVAVMMTVVVQTYKYIYPYICKLKLCQLNFFHLTCNNTLRVTGCPFSIDTNESVLKTCTG